MIALLLLILIMVFITTESQAETAQVAPEMREIHFDSKEVVQEVEPPEIEKYAVTAYCGCRKCCGKWHSVPAVGSAGIALYEGVSCAASYEIPLGAKVEIEGIGVYTVQDRPAKWAIEKHGGKLIDIYFANHESAWNFGKQERQVTIIDEKES